MIFVVDDEPSVRTALMRLLRASGYAARAFATPEECLDTLETTGEDVRCVILDVQMPGMSGPKLQQVINRRTPPLPVIFLTGTNDPAVLAMAAATAGAGNVLRKPCESERLLQAVAAAIGETPPPASSVPGRPTLTTTGSGRFDNSRVDVDDPYNFIEEEGKAVYRPLGEVSFDELVALVRSAIAAARRHQLQSLLVNTTALSGFNTPDQLERFLAVVAWAEESKGSVRLALVARPEMIHPQKFGVLVAANRGMASNIFATESEARDWLNARDDH